MNFFCFQAVQKPRKFFPSNCVFICCNTSRKAEFALFYSFIQQAETVTVPIQNFHLVAVPVVKYKHCVTELIEFEILLYNRRQAVYTFSHINICGGNVNLFRVDSQHLFSPPNTNSEKYTSFPSASSAARSIQYLRVLRFMPFSRQNFRPLSLLSVNFLTNKVPSCSVTITASFCVFCYCIAFRAVCVGVLYLTVTTVTYYSDLHTPCSTNAPINDNFNSNLDKILNKEKQSS